jgi:predicted SprT family Zn-dependent metalloprotease
MKEGVKTMHEISLNPESLSRSPQRVLSTLVHEMCHLQRQVTGKAPGRNNYHDKAWAEMMLAVGLTPYNTKDPDKMTGQNCSHHIDKGGDYQRAFKAMPADLLLPFTHVPVIEKEKAASKSGQKVKYTCPQCEANVWGKPEVNVLCGDCEDDRGRPWKMLAEGEEPTEPDDQDQDDEDGDGDE